MTEQAHDTRPRRPLREVVGDIDRDILRLLLRRHNLLARMHNSKGFLDPAEEKALRESWEAAVSRVSRDARLSGRFFSLMQEVEFLPRPNISQDREAGEAGQDAGASADLDGHPIALTRTGSHSYSAEITQNGTLTITAASVNGQTVTRTYQVSHLDTDKPELVNSYSQDGIVYLEILDTFSGIDYDHITGITPESVNTDTGVIAFRIPDSPTTVTVPDNAGNELTLLLSPVS